MDEQLQEPLRVALAELLRSVASAQVHLAAGTAADEEGYLQQDWRPFNSIQWLGVKLAEIAPATILSEEEQFTHDTAEADTAEVEAGAPIEAADDDAAELTGDQEATETAEASALEQDNADQEPPADTQ